MMPGRGACAAIGAILGLSFTGAALAQTATVRSGEHAGFTRIVIDLPPGAGWEASEVPGEVRLRFSRGVGRFDLGGVFDRIRRDRVAEISAGPETGELTLTLACPCPTKVFRAGAAMLVIDVADPLGAGPTRDAPPPTPVVALPLVLPGIEAAATALPSLAPAPETLRAAETRLLQQVARAASQGLVAPRQPVPAPVTVPPRPAKPTPEPVDTVLVPDPATGPAVVPLRAETARDAALMRHLRIDRQGRDDTNCLPDEALDIGSWGGEGFAESLADWRARLYGEFDRSDSSAAIGLARHYVHYGLGAEAVQSLAELGPEGNVLRDMAAVLDDDPRLGSGVLSGQSGCPGSAALWSLLAAPPSRGADVDAAVRTFQALPDHLQPRLGPPLADALSDIGRDDLAALVLRRLEQGGTGDLPEVQMAQAALTPEDAPDILPPVVADNGALSPQALIGMIERDLALGWPISTETADLAAAFAFEHRHGEAATELAWTAVLARAGTGDFPAAFVALDALDPAPPPQALGRVFDLLTRTAPDDLFVVEALQRLEDAALIPADPANALAQRLIDLGFAPQAETVLATPAEGAARDARRLLRARVALAQSLPRRAEAELLGLSGPEAERLRAEARLLAGEPGAAIDSLAAAAEPDAAIRAAFLAEDWSRLADSGGALSDLAARRTAAPEVVSTAGQLARGRALLDDSATLRADMERLLNEIAPVTTD